MIEDKDTGKFFKDAFDGYDTPFDADKMFQEIEGQIPTKKKSKRRVGFWILGCGGVIGLAAISILLFSQYQRDTSSINTNTNQSSQYQSNTDFTSSKKPAPIHKKSAHITDNNTTKNNESKYISPSITDITNKEKTQIITTDKDQTQRSVSPNESPLFSTSNQNETLDSKLFSKHLSPQTLPSESKSDVVSNSKISSAGPKRASNIRTIGAIDFAQLISPRTQFEPKLNIKNDFEISTPNVSPGNVKKWEIGMISSYLWTTKSSSYSGSMSSDWFNSYQQSEKLHHALNADLYLKYHVSNSWYITGSLSYLNAQESHSFSTSTLESIFDEDLIHTIIVDRNNIPLDTLYGAYREETTTKENYLVTTIDLIGIGVGVGRSFDINSKWQITSDIQLIPYITQKSNGLIIDPNGKLIDQSKLTLNGSQINLNNSILGTQLNFALQYKLSSKINFGLSSSYRYHIGNFSDQPILSVKRNYLGVGLKLGYMF